jgi:hypothetical protein
VVGHRSVLDGQRQQTTNHHSKNSPTPPLPSKTPPRQLASKQCPFATGFASKEKDSCIITRMIGHCLPALNHGPSPTTWPRQQHPASSTRKQQQTTRAPTQCPFHAGWASEERRFLYRSRTVGHYEDACFLHMPPQSSGPWSWTLAPKTAQEPHGHFLLHDSDRHRPPSSTPSSESWTLSPRRQNLIARRPTSPGPSDPRQLEPPPANNAQPTSPSLRLRSSEIS